jgi:hypothetical protein
MRLIWLPCFFILTTIPVWAETQAQSEMAALPSAAVQPAPPRPKPAVAPINAAQTKCSPIKFTGYSTKGGIDKTQIPEKFWWDADSQSYKFQGPMMAWMFDEPPTADRQQQYTIPVGRGMTVPNNRDSCHEHYQEAAYCDPDRGTLYYKRTFYDCSTGAINSTTFRITIDDLGKIPGIDFSIRKNLEGGGFATTQVLSDRDIRASVLKP